MDAERLRRHDQNNQDTVLLMAQEMMSNPDLTEEDRAYCLEVLQRATVRDLRRITAASEGKP